MLRKGAGDSGQGGWTLFWGHLAGHFLTLSFHKMKVVRAVCGGRRAAGKWGNQAACDSGPLPPRVRQALRRQWRNPWS